MYIIGFLILTVFYLLYIQFSPGMGNIWYRNNEYFSFTGAWHVIIFPLQSREMWNYSMWDINYFIWISFYMLIIILHHFHLKDYRYINFQYNP